MSSVDPEVPRPPARAPDGTGSRGWSLGRALKAALLAAGMILAVVAGMSLTLLVAIRGKEVVVPDVMEKTREEAEKALREGHLGIEIAATRDDPRIPSGSVIEQDPPAGSRTRPDRAVRVTLSSGEGTIEVPHFVGAPMRKAQLELKRLGLRVGVLSAAPSGAPADQVLAQRPAGGVRRQKGDPVDLLVSRGAAPRAYVMPLLTGISLERAESILGDRRIRAVIARRESRAGSPPGIVLDQQPPEGHPILERETARLVVSQ